MLRGTPRIVSAAVLLAGAAGLCGCEFWLGGSPTSGPPPSSAAATGASTAEVGLVLRGAEVPTAIPRASGRNPFTMAAPSPTTVVAVQPAVVRPPASEDLVDIPPSIPLLTLIGIAERRDAGEVRRTAIVAGLGEVFLAREGEPVTPRYVVQSIGEAIVELRERETGQILRLALKSSR